MASQLYNAASDDVVSGTNADDRCSLQRPTHAFQPARTLQSI